MKAYAITDIGKARSNNEDSYYIPRNGETFAAVADGMGGHKAGEVASKMAVEEFAKELRQYDSPSITAIERAVRNANMAVYNTARADLSMNGMGTTLTALWFSDDEAFLAHVGDSRAYLLRNNVLMQMSNDHSLVNELVLQGKITLEESYTHPQRNIITRSVGTSRFIEPDVLRFSSHNSDVWLLCSDGLSNYIRIREMETVLNMDMTWQEKAEELVRRALAYGGADNITCVIITGEAIDT